MVTSLNYFPSGLRSLVDAPFSAKNLARDGGGKRLRSAVMTRVSPRTLGAAVRCDRTLVRDSFSAAHPKLAWAPVQV